MFKSIQGIRALKKLAAGVKALSDVIKPTLGPEGKLSMIRTDSGILHSTKDGVTIASHFSVEDPFENMGVQAVMQTSQHTATRAGDGTSTSIIITSAILEAAMALINSEQYKIHEISEDLNKCTESVLEYLDKHTEECQNKEMLVSVATIAAGGNEELGKAVGELVWDVGAHGNLSIEISDEIGISSSLLKGYTFDRGMESPYFAGKDSPDKVVFKEECAIMVVDDEIKHPKETFEILKELSAKSVPLIIIAPAFSESVISSFVLNTVKSGVKVCAIQAPSFGKYSQDYLEDIAFITGAKVIKKKAGEKIESCKDSLGSASEVLVTNSMTSIIGIGNFEDEASIRAESIKNNICEHAEPFEKEHAQIRQARLVGGVGKIKIGASTELELREVMDRAEDAKGAATEALKSGVLAGAGDMLTTAAVNLTYGPGTEILSKALMAPRKQLIKNAGGLSNFPVGKLNKRMLIDKGIVDAAEVVKSSVTHAVSTALKIISTDSLLLEVKDSTEQNKG